MDAAAAERGRDGEDHVAIAAGAAANDDDDDDDRVGSSGSSRPRPLEQSFASVLRLEPTVRAAQARWLGVLRCRPIGDTGLFSVMSVHVPNPAPPPPPPPPPLSAHTSTGVAVRGSGCLRRCWPWVLRLCKVPM
jgi:hypothetical protein